MKGDRTRTVLCVDDQRTFLDVLRLAVESEDDLSCTAAVSSVTAAMEVLDRTPVDVVVMDVDLPDVDGIEGTRRVKAAHPEVRVVVLTAYADVDVLVRAVAAQADGFLTKGTPIAELLGAIRSDGVGVQLGEGTLATLRRRISDDGVRAGQSWSPNLTDREKEVLALLVAGVDAQHIAQQLGISLHTTRDHVRNLLAKLGVHSQLEAVAVAHRSGLVAGSEGAHGAT